MEDEYEEEVPFDPRLYEVSHPNDCSESEDGEPPRSQMRGSLGRL